MRAIIALTLLLIASPVDAGCGFFGLQRCHHHHRHHHHVRVVHKTIIKHVIVVRHVKDARPRTPQLPPIAPVK